MMARGAGGRFSGLSAQAATTKAGIQLGIEIQVKDNIAAAVKEIEASTVYSLKGAAYSLMVMARGMIATAAGPSAPGKPIHTRGRRKNIKAAIRYAVDKDKLEAVIGPEGPKAGPTGWLHEFGGRRGKGTYPARPYMAPALERTLPLIPQQFRSSLVGPGT